MPAADFFPILFLRARSPCVSTGRHRGSQIMRLRGLPSGGLFTGEFAAKLPCVGRLRDAIYFRYADRAATGHPGAGFFTSRSRGELLAFRQWNFSREHAAT